MESLCGKLLRASIAGALVFALKSGAASSAHAKKLFANPRGKLGCPTALFQQIYKRDLGSTLFDSANPSKACANILSDRMIGSSDELESTIVGTDLFAAQNDSQYLNSCLDSFDASLSEKQKNAAIGEYSYLTTRASVGFRGNLETIVSIDRMLGDHEPRVRDYNIYDLGFLPNAREWIAKVDRDPACASNAGTAFNHQVEDSYDALAGLRALEIAQSKNRESDVSYSLDGSSSLNYSVADPKKEAEIVAAQDWIYSQFPWLKQESFQKLIGEVGTKGTSMTRDKLAAELKSYFKNLRRKLSDENNKILTAQACLHSLDGACFKKNQDTFAALPPIDFKALNSAAKAHDDANEETRLRRVSLEFGLADCRLGARVADAKTDSLAADLALNVGLTLATGGASVIASTAVKGALVLGAKGVTLVTRVGTVAQLTRAVTVGADLVWFGKGSHDAVEACQEKVLAQGRVSTNPPMNFAQINCESTDGIKNSEIYRDMRGCMLSVGLAAVGALPLVPAAVFQSRKSLLQPKVLETPARAPIQYSTSELIPPFRGQAGFTHDAYDVANLNRGNLEVLVEVRRLEKISHDQSAEIVRKLQAGELPLNEMDKMMNTVMEAQYYREMREALENTGSAMGVALEHDTPLVNLPLDIAQMIRKGLREVSDVEKLRLLTWANNLTAVERLAAAKNISKARLKRSAGIADDLSESLSTHVSESVIAAGQIAPNKIYFQFTASELKQKIEIIIKPMLAAGIKPSLARDIADDLLRSGLAGSLGRR